MYSQYKLTNFSFIVFLDISATSAAFVWTIIHQVLLRQTVTDHKCVEIGISSGFILSTSFYLFDACFCFDLPGFLVGFYVDHFSAVLVYDVVRRNGVWSVTADLFCQLRQM